VETLTKHLPLGAETALERGNLAEEADGTGSAERVPLTECVFHGAELGAHFCEQPGEVLALQT